ncbi:hypothetical protein GWI33_009697 [Rhynchophorus ferrugineus]|uniref:Uncharacterized protein n=1 Tax=Rhynchophorus ferrugineus TaxID=354439 RepID=A0A834IBT5_RHYFE|nr:hypothetical protein GWI33_009697 [Rhynchophorus ferrugineus]
MINHNFVSDEAMSKNPPLAFPDEGSRTRRKRTKRRANAHVRDEERKSPDGGGIEIRRPRNLIRKFTWHNKFRLSNFVF